MSKKRRVLALSLLALAVLGLLPGCKKTEEYVEDLSDKREQSERIADEALKTTLESAALQLSLDRPGEVPSWDTLKGYLDSATGLYLEGLSMDCYSHKTLAGSIRDGGWFKVRQGWIVISVNGSLKFTYTAEKP